ncbi:uncharacterized protein Tco025E_03355 [Trypanosoma conorhini]|uniref:Uncharacterized protein n=1 Tax=Trypanosoma conorhini TaxID=83891 RepID=A0A422PUU8_9TRYP|nr:uncharacterized protein Tco025E_03355 [Trypanosoma conorhini]RNF21506.1 hypothetical protein Tco025E_03355 [Trypanosoma conorhini]
MTPLLLCVFVVGVLLAPGCVRGAPSSGIECPTNCSFAAKWCSSVFGQGGNVSFSNCGEAGFECTCNDAASIYVTSAEGLCTWTGSFDAADPNGSYCFSHTALCPSNCSSIEPWKRYCVDDVVCNGDAHGFSFSCTTCEGRTYSIVGDGGECKRAYNATSLACDPLTTCNGHGCCRRPGYPPKESPCRCFSDAVNGYWAPPWCSTCDDGYGPGKGDCTHQRPVIQKILSSIGSTWTMVLPNLAVLFLFVVFGVVRAEFESDRSFQSATLRKTGLSAVQVARRQQRGLFRSKYIPRRPAQSRCFLNEGETQPPRRGPPAY